MPSPAPCRALMRRRSAISLQRWPASVSDEAFRDVKGWDTLLQGALSLAQVADLFHKRLDLAGELESVSCVNVRQKARGPKRQLTALLNSSRWPFTLKATCTLA